jgi:Fe-S cluster biogenesis protein NfuA
MNKIKVTADSKKGVSWAVFNLNKSIGPNTPVKFKNIDEAAGAPLAQQLFYLPFVKSVKISKSIIEIEKFNILEWEEVLQEVTEQIETYLNEGGIVMNQQESDKIPVSIYAESTPNPSVMKFVANKPLVTSTFEFKNIEETSAAPLAKKLFHFPFVKEVFMDYNYISITKFEIVEWDEVVMEIREFIRNYIEEGNIVVEIKNSTLKDQKLSKGQELNDTEKQIVQILDEYIKPAVASDGGNIAFEKYDPDDKTVQVILQGACSGCPSSTFTLKNGIENMLKEMMPGIVDKVEAISG